MISQEHSNTEEPNPAIDPAKLAALNKLPNCPTCGGKMLPKQLRPYPVMMHVLFGASFLMFLFIFQKIKFQPAILWIWSGVQILIGVMLYIARKQARQKVLRCIRCAPDLR